MQLAFSNMRLDKKYMQISAKATISFAAYTQYALMSKENDEDSSNNKSPKVVFLSFFIMFGHGQGQNCRLDKIKTSQCVQNLQPCKLVCIFPNLTCSDNNHSN